MSNPSITATVAVDDQASPALKQLVELAKRVANETNSALKSSGNVDPFRSANKSAKEQLSTLANIKRMHHDIAAVAGGYLSGKVAHEVKEKVLDYGKYDKEVRLQQAASTDHTRPGGKFNAEDMDKLERQRIDAAKTRGVPVEQTLHAQNEFVKRQFTAEMTEAATSYAITVGKALDIPLEKAATLIEAMVFTQGEEAAPHDVAGAHKMFKEASDRATVMMKKGALSADDIEANTKYSGAMASVAHVSPQTNSAIAMTLMRAKISGESSGTFQRQLYARLLSPTLEGRRSLEAAGINYEDFSNHQSITPDAVSNTMKGKFGQELSPAAKKALQVKIDADDSKVLESGSNFAKAVVEAVEASDGKKLSKTDAKHVTSAAQSQYKLGQTNLQGDALLSTMLEKMSPEQLLAYLGVKQGAKFDMLKGALDTYKQNRSELDHGTGIAADIAAERQKGLGAALDRLASSADSAEKNLVKLAAAPIENVVGAITKVINAFDSLPDSVKMGAVTGGVLGLGAAALGSVAGVISLGASAANAAIALNMIATKGIPAINPIPGSGPVKPVTGSIPAAAPAVATATAASAGLLSKVAPVLYLGARALGVAGIVAAVTPIVYELVNDKAQGVDRDHSRPNAARAAIKADADERMRLELKRADDQAKDSAKQGDANIEQTNRRGGNGAVRRKLREEWDNPSSGDESKGLSMDRPVSVTGDLTGTANITANISVTPSPMFFAEINGIKSDVLRLKGQAGNSKTGVNMSGSNGAQPVSSNPSGGHH